jgi:hypothetical protein
MMLMLRVDFGCNRTDDDKKLLIRGSRRLSSFDNYRASSSYNDVTPPTNYPRINYHRLTIFRRVLDSVPAFFAYSPDQIPSAITPANYYPSPGFFSGKVIGKNFRYVPGKLPK